MISDVLSDSVAEIRDYLADDGHDGIYQGPMRAKIEAVIEIMDALRAKLDCVTPLSPNPPSERIFKEIVCKIFKNTFGNGAGGDPRNWVHTLLEIADYELKVESIEHG